MLDDKKKDLKNGIQKLDDDDTSQVSGGGLWSEIKDVGDNRISVTCDHCGAQHTIKIDSKDMSTWRWLETTERWNQFSNIKWTCDRCSGKNDIRAKRFGDDFGSGPWGGTNWSLS